MNIDITISEVHDAAQQICEDKYIERARGIAACAFVDGATWAFVDGATWAIQKIMSDEKSRHMDM